MQRLSAKYVTKQRCLDISGAANHCVFIVLSNTYMHWLVLISYLIVQCMVMGLKKHFFTSGNTGGKDTRTSTMFVSFQIVVRAGRVVCACYC